MSDDLSASDPLALLRRCRRLEARCSKLEKKIKLLAAELDTARAQAKTMLESIDGNFSAIMRRLGLCGLPHPDTGHLCALKTDHKATVHSSERLPKQEEKK